MRKIKRMIKENKTKYAARVVTEYGKPISGRDAWNLLVDKRSVSIKSWEHFQANLNDAVRKGLITKMRGLNLNGKMRVLYAPLTMTSFESEHFKGELATKVVNAVQRPNRATIENIPLGDVLTYNGLERDDVMSVLEDLIYDTPLHELRLKYPTLENIVLKITKEE